VRPTRRKVRQDGACYLSNGRVAWPILDSRIAYCYRHGYYAVLGWSAEDHAEGKQHATGAIILRRPTT